MIYNGPRAEERRQGTVCPFWLPKPLKNRLALNCLERMMMPLLLTHRLRMTNTLDCFTSKMYSAYRPLFIS